MKTLKTLALGSLLLCLALPSFAGFDVTRMTTVVDDFGGSYTVTTLSRLEVGDAVSTAGSAEAAFSSFHLRGEDASISGVMSQDFDREVGDLSSVTSAELALSGKEGTLTIAFTDLLVDVIDGEIVITGDVTINGTTVDVNDLPDGLAGLIRRLFRTLRR